MQKADVQTAAIRSAEPDPWSELSRPVFGVLGITIDATGLLPALDLLQTAVETRQTLLVSTPNVNFLVTSQFDQQFREALLTSDLCLVDGMPIVWVARLLGAPVKHRVSGADLFDALKSGRRSDRRFGIFLFGGAEQAVSRVGKILNDNSPGLRCAGTLNPGFGSIEEMSSDQIIGMINQSRADILAVFLSAKKAQAWLLRNHDRFQVPVRVQLGATINFEAGIINRAPRFVRLAGLEWLWRIKEEPHLWRRYWSDGKSLLRLVVTRALPFAVASLVIRLRAAWTGEGLWMNLREEDRSVVVHIVGFAVTRYIDDGIKAFREALSKEKPIEVDVSGTRIIDPRFFGLLLMVRKQLRRRGQALRFVNVSPVMLRAFRWSGFEFLLSDEIGGTEDSGQAAIPRITPDCNMRVEEGPS